MSDRRLKTVALLARPPGVAVLRDALIGHPGIELAAVLTHARRPRSEGGGERPERAEIEAMCRGAGVAFAAVDPPEARDIGPLLPPGPLDLLICLSWRFVLAPEILARFGLGGVNLHRGALPNYAGALPVQRAIEAGETRVAITAHEMAAEVDAGAPDAVAWMDIPPAPSGADAAEHAEMVKHALTPLYAPLARLAIAARLAAKGHAA